MRYSYQRLIFIGYAGLLCLSTHMPIRGRFYARDGNWLDMLYSNLTHFGAVMTLGSRDKLVHCAAYLLFTLLAFWAAASYPRIRQRMGGSAFSSAGIMILCAVLAWGLLDEGTQPIFGRVFDWHDYLANVLGAGLAVSLVAIVLRSKHLGPANRAADLLVDAPVVS